MTTLASSLHHIRTLDDLAMSDTAIHRIHPLSKLLVTLAFLLITISFDKYRITPLLTLAVYPVITMALAGIPAGFLLKRLLIVEPLIIILGIFNPILDRSIIEAAGISLTGGWVSFISLFIKAGLTVTAALLLIATTGIERIAQALRILMVPKLFVLQLLLTYRYITVLIEETSKLVTAYGLRVPAGRGFRKAAWGPLVGRLLLRTYDRARNVHDAMEMRGFEGEYHTESYGRPALKDFLFVIIWLAFFVSIRFFDINGLLGTILIRICT